MLASLAAVGCGRVVIRLPNWLGDALLAVPAIRAVRRAAPAARLELHARRPVAEALAALDGLGGAVVTAGDATVSGVLGDRRRQLGAAATLLLTNSFVTALPPFLARVPVRIGAGRDGRSRLLTEAVAVPGGRHQAGYYLGLVGAPAAVDPADAAVAIRAEARERGRLLAGDAPYAALVPGAAFGPAKRWGAERFAALGRRLGGLGLSVLVLGTSGEAGLCQAVGSGCGGRSLAGQTDGMSFAGILAGARLAVVNDSGALHLAAALGTPLVALFGATEPGATGPISGRSRVLHHRVGCSPCGLRACNRPSHLCMEAIAPEEALAAATELVEATASAAGGSRR